MAATGILAEAVTATKTALTALGLKPVTEKHRHAMAVMKARWKEFILFPGH
jgi:hypothetical protein